MSAVAFGDADVRQLEQRGLSLGEAERQLRLLRGPVHHTRLVRPATVGDGIRSIPGSDLPEMLALHAEAAGAGRLSKFVPASGAGSRMFEPLSYFLSREGRGHSWADVRRRAAAGDGNAGALVAFLGQLRAFPAYSPLKAHLAREGRDLDALAAAGDFLPILEALVGPGGLALDGLPKGLLGFHVDEGGARTAFEEHLVDAVSYVRDRRGVSRLHFTVSPEHREAFESLLRRIRELHGCRDDTTFEVTFSVQKPFTDTLALDSKEQPLRDADGRLRFRPGGHGALIENLNDLEGDLVFIRNIDNVQPDRLKQATITWKRVLAGHLVRLQREVFDYLARLREPAPSRALLDEARDFSAEQLHVHAGPGERERLIAQLDRPLRVCGVVPNTGEPGGGPFWVGGPGGAVGLQIVETAQVSPSDAEQQAILRAATHFNPVDLVCAVRDVAGRPFDLAAFADPDAVIIARKPEGGRDIRVLERPGLWNGGMAGWNTVFVEVPLQTFSPVKTVLDLLRDEHKR